MQKAWSNIQVVPYCFSRSSIKSQGHTGQKIADFDPNLGFPGCNPGLNSPMALKWFTKLDVVYKSCPVVFRSSIKFQGHTGRKIDDLNPIWVGRSQLSNPSDLTCFHNDNLRCHKRRQSFTPWLLSIFSVLDHGSDNLRDCLCCCCCCCCCLCFFCKQ